MTDVNESHTHAGPLIYNFSKFVNCLITILREFWVEGISFRLFPPNGQHQHAQPINVDIPLCTIAHRLFDEHLVTAPECYTYMASG